MTLKTQLEAEFLAGGTDLMERRRSGVSRGAVTPLEADGDRTRIAPAADGAVVLGAGVTIAAVAADAVIKRDYPGLAAAAKGLATPQIRSVATLGGNLAQRTRCWYYRNPHYACLKTGGATCLSRAGNHRYGVVFDLGPCVAPHPSTLGVALLAYDAVVTTTRRAQLSVADVLGDGRDGARDNMLEPGELITTVTLPRPMAADTAVYGRCISRARAEWPLVEAVVRIIRDGDRVRFARIAVGGVAPVPLRLVGVERRLEGAPLDGASAAAAAALAGADARPLAQTGYKTALLEGLLRDLLGRA